MLDNAFQQMIAINGPLNTWYWPSNFGGTSADNTNFLASNLANYIKIKKKCDIGESLCFGKYGVSPNDTVGGYYKGLDGTNANYNGTNFVSPYDRFSKLITADNMHIAINLPHLQYSEIYYSEAFSRIDINGSKGPNRYGYDVFFFNIGDKGIALINDKNRCKYNDNQDKKGWSSCGYWIMKHNSMDYKYRDVSAEW